MKTPKTLAVHVFIFVALLGIIISGNKSVLLAQDTPAPAAAPQESTTTTPWLEGVTIPNKPAGPAPVFPVSIAMADGTPFPASFSEDIPILVVAYSDIFGEKAPDTWGGLTLANSQWTGQTSVTWFFDEVEKNKSTLASCEEVLPLNQMKVTPLDPTKKGAVTVTVSRPFKYEIAPGNYRTIFANGGKGMNVRVNDITPPVCGLEWSVEGKEGAVWTTEAPPHGPLPKMSEVNAQGTLFSEKGENQNQVVAKMELGPNMILTSDQCQLFLPKNKEITVKMILQDNDQIDDKTVRCGVCEVNGTQIVPAGPENAAVLKLEAKWLPAKPYFYIEAKDRSGNHQRVCVPMKVL
jgi:hypothetical protein